jgi:hypothetical protein
VVTAVTQFCRQIGGTVGVAVFGALLTSRFVPAFHALLPASVAAAVPPAVLQQFENPQGLLNPAALSGLAERLGDAGPGGSPTLAALLEAVRLALAATLHELFLVATLIVALGAVCALFLPELPLRRSYRRGDTPASGAPPARADALARAGARERP